MHVLYFSRDYTPHDHRFLTALAGTEHEISFLCLDQLNPIPEDQPFYERIHLVTWEESGFIRRSDSSYFVRQLRGILDDLAPDLVHAGPIQRCAFLTALCDFQPLLSMSWGYDLLLDAKRDFLWDWVTRYTLAKSEVFVGDCETIRGLAVNYGMDADRVVIFPWGVDLNHFSPSHREFSSRLREGLGWEDAFVILHTRGWAPMYGSDEFLHGFAKAAQHEPDLRLIMLGDGPQGPDFQEIINEYELEDRVVFSGRITRKELPEYYQTADVYASASHSDGSSISLLEAMACGTPVIVSDIPGNKEWVQEGKQGWFFTVGDIQGITDTILKAVNNKEQLPEMGLEARQLAERRADWKENFPRLLDAYEMAVKGYYG